MLKSAREISCFRSSDNGMPKPVRRAKTKPLGGKKWPIPIDASPEVRELFKAGVFIRAKFRAMLGGWD